MEKWWESGGNVMEKLRSMVDKLWKSCEIVMGKWLESDGKRCGKVVERVWESGG